MYTFIVIFILPFLILLSSYCYCHIVTTKARLPSAVLPLLSDIDSIHSPDEPSDLVASYHVLIWYTFFFSAHEYKIVNNFETTKVWCRAGGFSYKSTWTLQELFPLIIMVVNICHLKQNKTILLIIIVILITKRFDKTKTETKTKKKVHSDYHTDITAIKRGWRWFEKGKVVNDEGGGGRLALKENVLFEVWMFELSHQLSADQKLI